MWKSRRSLALMAGVALSALSFSAAQAAAPPAQTSKAYQGKYETRATAIPKSLQAVPAIAREVAATAETPAAETYPVNAKPEVQIVASKAYATSLVASVPERPRPAHSADLNIAMISTSTLGAGAMPSRTQTDPDPSPRAANFVDTVLSAAIGRARASSAGLV